MPEPRITVRACLRAWCEEWHMRPIGFRPWSILDEGERPFGDSRAADLVMASLCEEGIWRVVEPGPRREERRELVERMILWRNWEPFQPPSYQACEMATRRLHMHTPPVKVGRPTFEGFEVMPPGERLPAAVDCLFRALSMDTWRMMDRLYSILWAEIRLAIVDHEKRQAEAESA